MVSLILLLLGSAVDGSPAVSTGRTNRIVTTILTSRFHRLLSRWLCVVDYSGRASGSRYITPTQYVADDSCVTILVGKHKTKSWWRNFTANPHPLRICIRGIWHDGTALAVTGTALAVTGATDADRTASLLRTYVAAFPRAAKLFPGDTIEQKATHACLVGVELSRDASNVHSKVPSPSVAPPSR